MSYFQEMRMMMIEDTEVIDIEGLCVEIELIDEYIPGRNVRKISDQHLQNARMSAYKKLKELELKYTAFQQEHLGSYAQSRYEMAKKFYRTMYVTCSKEVYRRFMKPNLISIPYANPQDTLVDHPSPF